MFVIKNGGPSPLGRDFLRILKFGLLGELKSRFKKLFKSGISNFDKGEIKLKLKNENIRQKFFEATSIPYALEFEAEKKF